MTADELNCIYYYFYYCCLPAHYDITEYDITEYDITDYDITDYDITEYDVTWPEQLTETSHAECLFESSSCWMKLNERHAAWRRFRLQPDRKLRQSSWGVSIRSDLIVAASAVSPCWPLGWSAVRGFSLWSVWEIKKDHQCFIVSINDVCLECDCSHMCLHKLIKQTSCICTRVLMLFIISTIIPSRAGLETFWHGVVFWQQLPQRTRK